jgi:dTDP-4-amino-4,6-dideoxygalactose transaminase
MKIPFNKSALFGAEIRYIMDALSSGNVGGDHKFSKECQNLMKEKFNAKNVFLTTSCSMALDMCGILVDLKPGDEIILPSYTFVTSANVFVLRGAKPVFVDIRKDTLNIDENKIEQAITSKTKAIVVVHYAGVACEMDKIMEIAKKHNLIVIEDAAQGVNATYKEKYLGTIGDLGAYSFHETKNYSCGEGGAIIINNSEFLERAEIIREKGTNRSKFLLGEVDMYTWVDVGNSFLPSDILAAVLLPQLENMNLIRDKRKQIYEHYYNSLKDLEEKGIIQLPVIPKECESNYHIFYLILKNFEKRNKVLSALKEKGIYSVFHYVPLHTAPMGKSFGYKEGDLPITERIGKTLIRLPFYYDLKKEEQDYIIKNLRELLTS